MAVQIYGKRRTATTTGHTPDGDMGLMVRGSGIWRKCYETHPPSFFGIDPGDDTTHGGGVGANPPTAANPSMSDTHDTADGATVTADVADLSEPATLTAAEARALRLAAQQHLREHSQLRRADGTLCTEADQLAQAVMVSAVSTAPNGPPGPLSDVPPDAAPDSGSEVPTGTTTGVPDTDHPLSQPGATSDSDMSLSEMVTGASAATAAAAADWSGDIGYAESIALAKASPTSRNVPAASPSTDAPGVSPGVAVPDSGASQAVAAWPLTAAEHRRRKVARTGDGNPDGAEPSSTPQKKPWRRKRNSCDAKPAAASQATSPRQRRKISDRDNDDNDDTTSASAATAASAAFAPVSAATFTSADPAAAAPASTSASAVSAPAPPPPAASTTFADDNESGSAAPSLATLASAAATVECTLRSATPGNSAAPDHPAILDNPTVPDNSVAHNTSDAPSGSAAPGGSDAPYDSYDSAASDGDGAVPVRPSAASATFVASTSAGLGPDGASVHIFQSPAAGANDATTTAAELSLAVTPDGAPGAAMTAAAAPGTSIVVLGPDHPSSLAAAIAADVRAYDENGDDGATTSVQVGQTHICRAAASGDPTDSVHAPHHSDADADAATAATHHKPPARRGTLLGLEI